MRFLHSLAACLLTAAVALGGAGCGDEHGGHADKDGDHAHGGPVTVEVPGNYKDAVSKIESLKAEMGGLIDKGELAKVHPAAEKIRRVAEKLPELATRAGMQPAMVKEVNEAARALQGLFDEIDKAADAGKKDETKAALAKYDAPIARLKAHAAHAGGGDDHSGHSH